MRVTLCKSTVNNKHFSDPVCAKTLSFFPRKPHACAEFRVEPQSECRQLMQLELLFPRKLQWRSALLPLLPRSNRKKYPQHQLYQSPPLMGQASKTGLLSKQPQHPARQELSQPKRHVAEKSAPPFRLGHRMDLDPRQRKLRFRSQ